MTEKTKEMLLAYQRAKASYHYLKAFNDANLLKGDWQELYYYSWSIYQAMYDVITDKDFMTKLDMPNEEFGLDPVDEFTLDVSELKSIKLDKAPQYVITNYVPKEPKEDKPILKKASKKSDLI